MIEILEGLDSFLFSWATFGIFLSFQIESSWWNDVLQKDVQEDLLFILSS